LKLLFDANLSPKLVARLADLFPGSAHVFDTGLGRLTSDEAIWFCAAANGFTIVTADSDFLDLARKRGAPPKLARIEKCDYRTGQVEAFLRRNSVLISDLDGSAKAVLVISERDLSRQGTRKHWR
jgi:predicted nuclease of predicted toxin-antitoxin system